MKPPRDHHVLGPVDDVQVAVVVEAADVAGVQPVARQRFGGLVGQILVPGHHQRTPSADLPRTARRDRSVVGVEQGDVHPRHGTATRREAIGAGEIVLALLQVGDDHRRLGLPEELEEDRPPVLDRTSELGRAHRRRPIEDGLHRRHVGRVVSRMSLQRIQHDGDDQRRRDAMLRDQVEEAVRVERLHHVERSARQQHGRDERHRSMGQRRRDRRSAGRQGTPTRPSGSTSSPATRDGA